MRKAAGILLMLMLVGLAQFGLAPRLAVLGIKPDFLLLAVVAGALRQGAGAGAWQGAWAGFLEDVFVGQYLGTRAFAMAAAGLLTGYARTRVFGDQPLVPVTAALCASGVCEMFTWSCWRAVGLALPFWAGLVQVIVPVSIYNALLAGVILGSMRYRNPPTRGDRG